jgi:hypothetical protein
MLASELFEKILHRLQALEPEFQMPLLQREMLMECCEKAVATSYSGDKQREVLMLSSLHAFEVSQGLIKNMVKGLTAKQVGTITLNYRGQIFTLDSSSI